MLARSYDLHSCHFLSDGSHYEKRGKGDPVCIDDEIPFEIPESWAWCRFSTIANFLNGDRSKNYPNKNEYVPDGVAWINTGHITPDGYLNTATMNYITETKYDSLSGGSIQPGDLVFCLRGATFGKIVRVEPFERGAIASSLMIIRLVDLRLREYVFAYLRSPLAFDELHKYDNGSAQPNLAAKDVERHLVPIPPIAEQTRIVAQIVELIPLTEEYGALEDARECLDADLPPLGALSFPAMMSSLRTFCARQFLGRRIAFKVQLVVEELSAQYLVPAARRFGIADPGITFTVSVPEGGETAQLEMDCGKFLAAGVDLPAIQEESDEITTTLLRKMLSQYSVDEQGSVVCTIG